MTFPFEKRKKTHTFGYKLGKNEEDETKSQHNSNAKYKKAGSHLLYFKSILFFPVHCIVLSSVNWLNYN